MDKPEEETDAPPASVKRLLRVNAPEWPYIAMGLVFSIIAGLSQPSFAFIFAEFIKVSRQTKSSHLWKDHFRNFNDIIIFRSKYDELILIFLISRTLNKNDMILKIFTSSLNTNFPKIRLNFNTRPYNSAPASFSYQLTIWRCCSEGATATISIVFSVPVMTKNTCSYSCFCNHWPYIVCYVKPGDIRVKSIF